MKMLPHSHLVTGPSSRLRRGVCRGVPFSFGGSPGGVAVPPLSSSPLGPVPSGGVHKGTPSSRRPSQPTWPVEASILRSSSNRCVSSRVCDSSSSYSPTVCRNALLLAAPFARNAAANVAASVSRAIRCGGTSLPFGSAGGAGGGGMSPPSRKANAVASAQRSQRLTKSSITVSLDVSKTRPPTASTIGISGDLSLPPILGDPSDSSGGNLSVAECICLAGVGALLGTGEPDALLGSKSGPVVLCIA
jgi:hypothetical protein